MHCPFSFDPRKTLNPKVTFPCIVLVPVAPSGTSGFGGAMRPPPVHFPVVHCSTPPQKFGRCGAVLIFVWSLQAAATSPTATKRKQTSKRPPSPVTSPSPSTLFFPSR